MKKQKEVNVVATINQKTITYNHRGIKVRINTDYDNGTISIVDKNGQPYKYVFSDRQIEYMQGWQDILDGIKYAIEKAASDLRSEQEARRKETELVIAKGVKELMIKG